MGHGVPIDPSGPERLGQAGPYMLDVGLSSSRMIADAWGLTSEARATRPNDRTSKRLAGRGTPQPADSANAVQAIIARALRAAGLLH